MAIGTNTTTSPSRILRPTQVPPGFYERCVSFTSAASAFLTVINIVPNHRGEGADR
jgi:hypothetical protein